jgi:hypothetical protein
MSRGRGSCHRFCRSSKVHYSQVRRCYRQVYRYRNEWYCNGPADLFRRLHQAKRLSAWPTNCAGDIMLTDVKTRTCLTSPGESESTSNLCRRIHLLTPKSISSVSHVFSLAIVTLRSGSLGCLSTLAGAPYPRATYHTNHTLRLYVLTPIHQLSFVQVPAVTCIMVSTQLLPASARSTAKRP